MSDAAPVPGIPSEHREHIEGTIEETIDVEPMESDQTMQSDHFELSADDPPAAESVS